MKTTVVLALAALPCLTAQDGNRKADRSTAKCIAARDAMMKAVYAVDFPDMRRAKQKLAKLFEDEGVGAAARYHAAYTNWWLSRDQDATPEQRSELRQEGIELLKRVTDLRPEHADAWALLSWFCLIELGVDPRRGAQLGPLIGKAEAAAKKFGAANPRVAMFEAMSLAATPAEYGGDKEQARERFREAVKLEVPETDGAGPAWGRAVVLAQYGLFLLNDDRPKEAVAAFEGALELEPKWRMVRQRGLPRAEAALARAEKAKKKSRDKR